MSLETYLRGLDRIDSLAKERGFRLFVSTFRVMAFDGMLLSRGGANNQSVLYDTLNAQYWWPYTYAEIHRITEFYNRTLRAWATARGHDIIAVNEEMPWQSELYGDGLHEMPAGEALHAWIVLQHLMPAIRDDLAHHRVPRPTRAPRRDLESYWHIERTNLADAVVRAPAEPADDVAGAFPLSKLVAANTQAEIVPGKVPLIRTALEPAGYAASIPIQPGAAAGVSGRGWISVRMKVNEGRVTVGVLNRSSLRFLAYASLERTPDIQVANLVLDDLADVGSLMISNNRTGESARSIAELYSVDLKRVR